MSDILRSLAITLGISFAVGLLLYFTKGIFITPFAITLVTQLIISFVVNSTLEVWRDHLRRQTDNEMYKEMSRIGIDTECSYCGEIAYVPVDLSTDNRYTCSKCNKENRIVIDTRSINTTEPTTTNPQEILHKNKDEQEVLHKDKDE